jgi:hypothetical protein
LCTLSGLWDIQHMHRDRRTFWVDLHAMTLIEGKLGSLIRRRVMWRVENTEETKTEVVKVQLGDEPIIGMKVPSWMRGAVRAALRRHEAQLHLYSTCAQPEVGADGDASHEDVRRVVPMAGRPWSVTMDSVKKEAVTAKSIPAAGVTADSIEAVTVKAEAERDAVRCGEAGAARIPAKQPSVETIELD